MRPSAAYRLLTEARSEGVIVTLKGDGTIRVRAPHERLDHWLTTLWEHKPELLVLLAARPALGT